jgi:hypothetical protein
MTIQEQQFLVSIMNLSVKLKINDTTVMDDVAAINSSELLTDNTKSSINNIMEAACSDVTTLNKSLLKSVINSFNFIDQFYFNELIDFTMVDKSNITASKEYLNTVLSKELKFNDSRHEYFFLTRLVNMCISSRDTDLTKKALDKVQSIHAV